MGAVNCCEESKNTLYNEEIETNLHNTIDRSKNLMTPQPKNTIKNTNDVLKTRIHYDAKTEKILKIQSTLKRWCHNVKFFRRINLHQIALKEYFRTHGVLCENNDINSYIHPNVLQIEKEIKNRTGIYSNPNIQKDIMSDISYQPFYSIEMPCTYLMENHNNQFYENKSNPYFTDKDLMYSTTNNHSDNENNSQKKKPVYKGFWSIDRKKNGYGILVNSDGSKYEGLFRNGKLEGKGRYITVKGDFFNGNFKNGAANGLGTFIHFDGSIYNGQWMNDLPWGEGSEWSNEGAIYKGDFFQGKKYGIGEFKWNDGAVYLGGVKNDLLNGEGIYTWPDGRKYRGFWYENNMHGYGCLINSDGTMYEGQFEKNKKHGHGKYIYTKDKYYEGGWLNGKQHGKGKLVKNGIEEYGEWFEGKRKKE